MRNFVVKNDFNKASVHKDKKNDYTRDWDLEEELNAYQDTRTASGTIEGSDTDDCEEDSK